MRIALLALLLTAFACADDGETAADGGGPSEAASCAEVCAASAAANCGSGKSEAECQEACAQPPPTERCRVRFQAYLTCLGPEPELECAGGLALSPDCAGAYDDYIFCLER